MPNGLEQFFKKTQEPPKTDCPFEIGQTVRVLQSVTDDGQTPQFWAGALVKVIGQRCTMIHKEWLVKLEYSPGVEDWFKCVELDYRFIRGKKNKKL